MSGVRRWRHRVAGSCHTGDAARPLHGGSSRRSPHPPPSSSSLQLIHPDPYLRTPCDPLPPTHPSSRALSPASISPFPNPHMPRLFFESLSVGIPSARAGDLMWRRVAPFRQCGPLIGPEEGLRRAESAAAQSEAARRRRGVVAASPCPQESYRADTPLPPRPPDGPQQAGSEASDGVSPSLARVPASAGELPRVAPVRSHGHPPRRQHSARPGRRTGERALLAEEQLPAVRSVPGLGADEDAAFLGQRVG